MTAGVTVSRRVRGLATWSRRMPCIRISAAAAPVWRDRLLDALELGRDMLGRRLGAYSKGMRQKLALVAATQHAPELLIFDEPTDGLDPLIQRNFEELLREFRAEGTTIFMSSHDLGEVERLCDQLAVVRAGKLIASGSMASLKRQFSQRVEITFANTIPIGIEHVAGASMTERNGSRVTLHLDRDINPLLHFLACHEVERMVIRPPELQEVFLGYYEQGEAMADGAPLR